MQVLHVTVFSQLMVPVLEVLKIFLYSGIVLAIGITIIAVPMLCYAGAAMFDTAAEE
jgi:hypothetical protein